MKFLKGWRTVIVNAVMAAPLAWDVIWAVIQTSEFQALIPAQYMPFYALAVSAVNIWLRKITTTPMGHKS